MGVMEDRQGRSNTHITGDSQIREGKMMDRAVFNTVIQENFLEVKQNKSTF